MNYSAIDLDIDNYSISDLEHFLQLENNAGAGYGVIDIEQKVGFVRSNFMEKIADRGFQSRLLIFLDEAKRLLIQHLKTNRVMASGGSHYVIDKSTEASASSVTNFIQPVNTFPTETAPGVLNRLRRRTNFVSLAMNTFFRDPKSGSSTDCFFVLSYPLKNVVSMRLLSLELPEGVYLLSNGDLTNRLYIVEYAGDGSKLLEGLVVVPEGCYCAESLAAALQNSINEQLGTQGRFAVGIDGISFRTTIINSVHNFDMYFVTQQTNTYLNRNLGWILGYRNPTYLENNYYTSEGLFNGVPLDYMYFVLDDFNLSRSSNLIAVFNDSFIDKNILAKIPYSNWNFQVLFEGKDDVISPRRQYFGPVDIRKLGLQLINKYGQIINLNNMDFSFTLEVEMAYDI
jgi:hypothetical protein